LLCVMDGKPYKQLKKNFMANAERDENSVPTLLALSSAGDGTIVTLYADPTSHRLLVTPALTTGTTSPSSTPSAVGQMYIDTSGKKIYFATGTTNSSDWTVVN